MVWVTQRCFTVSAICMKEYNTDNCISPLNKERRPGWAHGVQRRDEGIIQHRGHYRRQQRNRCGTLFFQCHSFDGLGRMGEVDGRRLGRRRADLRFETAHTKNQCYNAALRPSGSLAHHTIACISTAGRKERKRLPNAPVFYVQLSPATRSHITLYNVLSSHRSGVMTTEHWCETERRVADDHT